MLTGTDLLIRDLREERNRALAEANNLRAALRRIEKHHVEMNTRRGRLIADSETLRLVREVLQPLPPESSGGGL